LAGGCEDVEACDASGRSSSTGCERACSTDRPAEGDDALAIVLRRGIDREHLVVLEKLTQSSLVRSYEVQCCSRPSVGRWCWVEARVVCLCAWVAPVRAASVSAGGEPLPLKSVYARATSGDSTVASTTTPSSPIVRQIAHPLGP
jgi:hypothetical protein